MGQGSKQTIRDYLKTQLLCVIATIDHKGRPQAATVAFSENNKLELYIGTPVDTRKYTSLKRHPPVALVIGVDASHKISVQYEGVAVELQGRELARCRQQHIAKNPSATRFVNDPLERFFKVTPTWIRFCDYRHNPTSFEITFNEKKITKKKA